MDLEVLLSYLYDKGPEILEAGSRAAIKRAVPGVSSGLDYMTDTASNIFQPMSFEDTEEDKARKAKIAEAFAAKEADSIATKEKEDAAKEQLLKMKQAREQDDWVRSVGYEPDQTFSSPDQGILMKDMDPSTVARIRAQAAMKGEFGSLRGRGGTGTEEDLRALVREKQGPEQIRGSFVQPKMTPELLKIQAENEMWANQQPMRDAEFSLTPQQSARRPDNADRAAQTLSEMQRNQAIQKEQAMQSQLVQSLGGSSGKIPFEKAMQLQAAGVKVPYGATGMSKEDAIATFDSAIQQASEDLARMNPLDAVGDKSLENRIILTRYAASLADMYKQRVAAGMNPDEAKRNWQEEITRMMMEAGFLNTNEMVAEPGVQ